MFLREIISFVTVFIRYSSKTWHGYKGNGFSREGTSQAAKDSFVSQGILPAHIYIYVCVCVCIYIYISVVLV